MRCPNYGTVTIRGEAVTFVQCDLDQGVAHRDRPCSVWRRPLENAKPPVPPTLAHQP